jgi:Uncharacterised protein family (UPF0158)
MDPIRQPVRLNDVVEAIDLWSGELAAYLSVKTGEIAIVSEDDMRAAEDEEPLDDYPEWQHDHIRRAGDILAHDEDYLALPDKSDFHEYRVMERFCLALHDRETSESLYHVIKGKGAFRRFKDALDGYGLTDKWYAYRQEALRQLAIDWCAANNVDFRDE